MSHQSSDTLIFSCINNEERERFADEILRRYNIDRKMFEPSGWYDFFSGEIGKQDVLNVLRQQVQRQFPDYPLEKVFVSEGSKRGYTKVDLAIEIVKSLERAKMARYVKEKTRDSSFILKSVAILICLLVMLWAKLFLVKA